MWDPVQRGVEHLGAPFMGTGTAGGWDVAGSYAVIIGSWGEKQI